MTLNENTNIEHIDNVSRLEPFLDTQVKYRSTTELHAISEVTRYPAGKYPNREGNLVDMPSRFSKKIKGNHSSLITHENSLLLAIKQFAPDAKVVTRISYAADLVEANETVYEIVTKNAGVDMHKWYHLPVKLQYNQQPYRNIYCNPLVLLQFVKGCVVALHSIHKYGIIHCDIKEDQICIPFSFLHTGQSNSIKPYFDDITLIDFGTSVWQKFPMMSNLNPLPFNIEEAAPYQAKRLIELASQQVKYFKQNKEYNFNQVISNIDCAVDLYSLGFMLKTMLDVVIANHINIGDAGAWMLFHDDYKKWVDELLSLTDKVKPFSNQPLPHQEYIQMLDKWIKDVEQYVGYTTKDLTFDIALDDAISQQGLINIKVHETRLCSKVQAEEKKINVSVTPPAPSLSPTPVPPKVHEEVDKVDTLQPNPLTKNKTEKSSKKWVLGLIFLSVLCAVGIITFTGKNSKKEPLSTTMENAVPKTSGESPAKPDSKEVDKAVITENVQISQLPIYSKNDYKIDDNLGIAISEKTKLQWRRCLLGQTWNISTQNCDGIAESINSTAIQAKIDELNQREKTNWRLANAKEMTTLLQCSTGFSNASVTIGGKTQKINVACKPESDMPAIDSQIFSAYHGLMWTSTEVHKNDMKYFDDKSEGKWAIDFDRGIIVKSNTKSDSIFVALVK